MVNNLVKDKELIYGAELRFKARVPDSKPRAFYLIRAAPRT